MNRSPREMAALTAEICVSPPITEMKVGLRLSRRIGQHFPDKAVQAQLDAGRGLLRALHVGEPAEPKVCIFHSDSFFSWVRIWVLPLAKTSVSSCENRSPIVQDLGAVLFLFFPMIGELHRSPVGNVAVFTFAEYAIEHSCSAEQADMSTMQWREWTASHIPLLGQKHSTRLTIGRGIEQQILHFIQRNAGVGEYSQVQREVLRRKPPCSRSGQRGQVSKPASLTSARS